MIISLLVIAASLLSPSSGAPRTVQRVSIAGEPGYAAVTLSTPHPGIAVLDTGTNALIWSRTLPSVPDRLSSPGPAGLFQAVVSSRGSTGFLAFTMSGNSVTSAIYQQPSGEIIGNAGVSTAGGTVRVANHDRSHVGSVAYRTVVLYRLTNGTYWPTRSIEQPDYSGDHFPTPSALFVTAGGSRFLLRVGLACTEAEREYGLMYVRTLDPDAGMLFTWPGVSTDPFWMENTYVPLTVAFVNSNGVIIGMDDMAALTLDFHYAPAPYAAAIEANQGYFASHGISVGDRVIFLGTDRGLNPVPN